MKALFFLLLTLSVHGLDVASLHPLITDTVKQVGGDRVTVIEAIKPGDNIHQFTPKAEDILALSEATLIFASGMKLEPYLDDLRENLKADQTIVEVGRTIPAQKVSPEDQIYACCDHHSTGGVDPHWWHNVSNMGRAVRVIEQALVKADPEGKDTYAANAKATRDKLTELDRWVKGKIAEIPKEKRHLVTAHAAFGYFCKGYGLKASYVQGLSAHGEITATQLAGTIMKLRKEAIPTVFPEAAANPKILKQIAEQTGAKLGSPLIADGSCESYHDMITSNVRHVVDGLK